MNCTHKHSIQDIFNHLSHISIQILLIGLYQHFNPNLNVATLMMGLQLFGSLNGHMWRINYYLRESAEIFTSVESLEVIKCLYFGRNI